MCLIYASAIVAPRVDRRRSDSCCWADRSSDRGDHVGGEAADACMLADQILIFGAIMAEGLVAGDEAGDPFDSVELGKRRVRCRRCALELLSRKLADAGNATLDEIILHG